MDECGPALNPEASTTSHTSWSSDGLSDTKLVLRDADQDVVVHLDLFEALGALHGRVEADADDAGLDLGGGPERRAIRGTVRDRFRYRQVVLFGPIRGYVHGEC